MGRVEFIGLMAMLMALNALAIDIMLPGLQQIGAALGVENENHRQYVVSAYLFGFGLAQLAYGPVSDRFGRRKPMLFGLAVYVISSLAVVAVPSFAGLLALRFIQGIGSAAMRVITISIVRDIYGGRAMAEVMSLIMMVFMVVPVIAPGTGQIILLFGDWHLIFVFMALVALAVAGWMYIRLPETLHEEDVRPFTVTSVLDGFRIVLTNRVALCYTIASMFIFGALFGFINSAQQVYVGIYGLGVWFSAAFAAVAVFMAFSSFVNARLVGRFGMRGLSHASLLGFIGITCLWLLVQVFGPQPGFRQTVIDGIGRKAVVVLLAREPLLLRRRDDAAIDQQGCRRVVVEGRDTEDGSHAVWNATARGPRGCVSPDCRRDWPADRPAAGAVRAGFSSRIAPLWPHSCAGPSSSACCS